MNIKMWRKQDVLRIHKKGHNRVLLEEQTFRGKDKLPKQWMELAWLEFIWNWEDMPCKRVERA